MPALFYDLETSDKNFIGQILNYCFVLVDDDFSIKDELSGEIALSRLQLPHPEAILANRIDVLKHQQETVGIEYSERVVMGQIADFIRRCIPTTGEKLALVGFNSSRFDLPYLRTSLIRNGINPYFGGKLVYRDVYSSIKKLCVSCNEFPWQDLFEYSNPDGPRLSLRLEAVAQQFQLLSGAQSHHSRDDVFLTIDLAKFLLDRFSCNVLTMESYEPSGALQRGTIRTQLFPNYDDPGASAARVVPMVLLDQDYRYALWINLDRFREGQDRSSINWFNKSQTSFVQGPPAAQSYADEASRALETFKGIRLSNYFQTSQCDIEQDIYRVDMQLINSLSEAMWNGNPKPLQASKNRDAWRLYVRFLLREYAWKDECCLDDPNFSCSEEDAKMRDLLCKYALQRYGGSLRLDKGFSDDPQYHDTYKQLLELIVSLQKDADQADRALLQSLRTYYESSELTRVAGQQLLSNSDSNNVGNL